jgi:N utilization substance protein A
MISNKFFEALNEIANERGMEIPEIISDLEIALSSAFRKQHGEAMNARVVIDPERKTIKVYSYKTVVADEEEKFDSEEEGFVPFDYDKFITLTEAKEIKKSAKIGDVLEQEENVKDFGRVAAITVKQVLAQKIKERGQEAALKEITVHQDKVLTAKVLKFNGGKYFLEIPNSTIQGVLDERNNIPEQSFKSGDFIKVYVPRLNDNNMMGEIFVTRTRAEFVKALFYLEVPEIERSEIEIKSIAREAGYRTKIAVASGIANIDPIGACVGAKGSRINNILNEIRPEKIDVIPWSEDPLEFIASALSPATVLRVEANEEEKHARVVVPNDKLSLAIGKGGMNVRLAAKLTGWKIDVKSEEKASAEDAAFIEEFDIGG